MTDSKDRTRARSGRGESESMTARTQDWEARTQPASSITVSPGHRSVREALRAARTAGIKELSVTNQRVPKAPIVLRPR